MDDKLESLILVTSASQLKRAYRLCDYLSCLGRRSLILTAYEIEADSDKYPVRNLSYYQELFKINYLDIKQSAYNLFYSLASEEVYNGITLRNLTSYKDVSLWDLSVQYVFSELIPFIYYLDIADKILEFEKPQEVYAINSDTVIEEIFNLLCRKRLINFNAGAKSHNLKSGISKGSAKPLIFLKKIKRLCVSFYFSMLNFFKFLNLKGGRRIIFFVPTERFFISMLPVIRKYSDSERLVINNFLSGSSKKLKESRIFYTDMYGYNLYSLFNIKTERFLKRIKTALFRDDSVFFKDMLYKGLPIGGLLIGIFRKAIAIEFPEIIREIDIVRKIILSYKPKVIVLGGAPFKITLIAKTLSVSVVAIQSIYPGDFIFFSPVLADAFTVDGSFWKEYLCRQDVEHAKIWITGSLKFDFLKEEEVSQIRLKPAERSAELDSDKSKKKVIFATNYSSLAMGSLKYQNINRIRSVCEAMKNIREGHLVIKLHPYDNDFGIYKNVARQAGLRNYSIIKNADMFGLLRTCDLLITHISAVSYEAVLMDRKVILLCGASDFQNEDVWDFRRYGVAEILDNLKDLEKHIRRLLFSPEAESMLKKNRQEYIYEHAYKLDGNAAFRVKEVIDRFVKAV